MNIFFRFQVKYLIYCLIRIVHIMCNFALKFRISFYPAEKQKDSESCVNRERKGEGDGSLLKTLCNVKRYGQVLLI